MIIEYHPAVERELEEIRDYYNSRVPELGTDFLDEFDSLVLRIGSNPRRWMLLRGEIRRALMRRFPYVIYFRPVNGERIRIIVVKHQRRHPSRGLRRQ
jgi:toxin ParE1/3/4